MEATTTQTPETFPAIYIVEFIEQGSDAFRAVRTKLEQEKDKEFILVETMKQNDVDIKRLKRFYREGGRA